MARGNTRSMRRERTCNNRARKLLKASKQLPASRGTRAAKYLVVRGYRVNDDGDEDVDEDEAGAAIRKRARERARARAREREREREREEETLQAPRREIHHWITCTSFG